MTKRIKCHGCLLDPNLCECGEPLQRCKGCGRYVEHWHCDDCEDGGDSIAEVKSTT